jgi:(2Fe-2S) ferredoxin
MSKIHQIPVCVLYTCCGSKCKKRGGKHLYKILKAHVKALHLKRSVQVIKTGCTDRCKHGPVVAVMPENTWHLEVTDDKGYQILQQQLLKNIEQT